MVDGWNILELQEISETRAGTYSPVIYDLRMETDSELWAEISRRLAVTKNIHYHYQEYIAIGEDICVSMPFKNYFTIKYGFWPKNVDEDSLKRRGK